MSSSHTLVGKENVLLLWENMNDLPRLLIPRLFGIRCGVRLWKRELRHSSFALMDPDKTKTTRSKNTKVTLLLILNLTKKLRSDIKPLNLLVIGQKSNWLDYGVFYTWTGAVSFNWISNVANLRRGDRHEQEGMQYVVPVGLKWLPSVDAPVLSWGSRKIAICDLTRSNAVITLQIPTHNTWGTHL